MHWPTLSFKCDGFCSLFCLTTLCNQIRFTLFDLLICTDRFPFNHILTFVCIHLKLQICLTSFFDTFAHKKEEEDHSFFIRWNSVSLSLFVTVIFIVMPRYFSSFLVLIWYFLLCRKIFYNFVWICAAVSVEYDDHHRTEIQLRWGSQKAQTHLLQSTCIQYHVRARGQAHSQNCCCHSLFDSNFNSWWLLHHKHTNTHTRRHRA